MFWTVRGTNQDGKDYSLVLEAENKAEAEFRVMKRGLPIVIIEEATDADVRQAKAEKMLWKYRPDPVLMAFGKRVSKFDFVCLMICFFLTLVVVLDVSVLQAKASF